MPTRSQPPHCASTGHATEHLDAPEPRASRLDLAAAFPEATRLGALYLGDLPPTQADSPRPEATCPLATLPEEPCPDRFFRFCDSPRCRCPARLACPLLPPWLALLPPVLPPLALRTPWLALPLFFFLLFLLLLLSSRFMPTLSHKRTPHQDTQKQDQLINANGRPAKPSPQPLAAQHRLKLETKTQITDCF